MNTKNIQFALAALFTLFAQMAIAQVSQTWVADLRNGTYQNPVLYADYSDPDACRVGDGYYMTASSFNCVPGLPILYSKDLVNWAIINHAIEQMPSNMLSKDGVNHGGGVWAPSIRFHQGEYYIYYGDPDLGIFMTKAKDPLQRWEPLVFVKEGKGLIDACPLFDDDGQIYLVHAYAGSRAGIKSLLAVTVLSPDGKKALGESRIIYDGHGIDPTIEGPKFYKRNGYYYIFAPAGGVATGWQTVLRSKKVFGPYERKIVLAQGNTNVNGPHQGAWVNTQTGEDWFLHFQDTGPFGRVTHLQPMTWKDDWPVIGYDPDGDGCGEPVPTYRKPDTGKDATIITPAESDEFNRNKLGLQWQWNANPQSWWYFANEAKGCLHLYSVPVAANSPNLWNVPNLLLQKVPASSFTASAKLTFKPDSRFKGERTGLIVMGMDYALLSIENSSEGFILSQAECLDAEKGNPEQVNASVRISEDAVYLRVTVTPDAICSFSYSIDGEQFKRLGNQFKAKEGKWIGTKIGLFCTRPDKWNDGGYAEIDWFRLTK
jgi:beta-xylosidase